MNVLLAALGESGYATQTAVAEAVYNTGIYKGSSVDNIRAFFCQITHGQRRMSPKLRSALLQVAPGNEKVIEILDNYSKPLGKLDANINKLFRDYSKKLETEFPKLSRVDRIRIVEGPEKLCSPKEANE